jgi:ubiquinone/menaquinone biosynthesis C-methylase UbiE
MADHEAHCEVEEANRRLWDEKARVRIRTYKGVQLLRDGHEILHEIELREVGDVRGKKLLHLQCHIGTDTLAWARRGAIVTGVDFSGEAIRCAEGLRDELGLDARFVRANVYDLPQVLDEEFDLVYTSRGVLRWLWDLETWARIVARFLAPGGAFYLMETHPILNALEGITPEIRAFVRSYSHHHEPARRNAGGPDSADPSHRVEGPAHEWNWALSDVVNAILGAGLRIEILNEHGQESFRQLASTAADDGPWHRLPPQVRTVPLLFTLRACKGA